MTEIPKEKRAYQRQEYDTTLSIQTEGDLITGKLRNISPGGAKFGCDKFIMPMTRLTVSFPDASPLQFKAIVIWTLRVNSHSETGIFFEALTPEHDLWLADFCARLDEEL